MEAERARQILAERARRTTSSAAAAERRRIVAELRAWLYPKQRAFYAPGAKRKALRKTRRAGATVGGVRELTARALEHRGFRATYCNETRGEARDLAWESDTKSGLVDILIAIGTRVHRPGVPVYRVGDVDVEIREQELALDFSNGSRIDLFGADDERALDKLRGKAKHVVWIDEAQKFRFLRKFVLEIVGPCMPDFEGEIWISGTPDRHCGGYFYDVTRDPNDGDGEPEPGWEVHELSVTDNPFFGDTAEERWERTAGKAIAENKWKGDEPELLREWFARWVKTDALFVYAAHRIPKHELCFAPARLAADGIPDVAAALLDLPVYVQKRAYFLALGADLGTTGGFAWVLWAWSLQDPVLYEVASWKRAGLDYDQMADALNAVRAVVSIGLVTADAGGGGKPAVMGWSKRWVDRYGIPIVEATKTNKEVAIAQLNTDITTGKVRIRDGGALLAEWVAHKWAPLRSATGRLVEQPGSPNHVADAALYAHRESYHHRFRDLPLTPERNSPESLLREEAELEDAAQGQDHDDYHDWH